MSKKNIANLLYIMYDYKPQNVRGAIMCVDTIWNYLTKKHYIYSYKNISFNGYPTKKAFKLLKKYNIIIPEIKNIQKIFNSSNVLTLIDRQTGEQKYL